MRSSVLSLLVAGAAAVNQITIDGNAFWDGSERFYVRGVDYQPLLLNGTVNSDLTASVIDPLADATTCKRDIAVFTELGLNTIRVYTVDNTADHKECMELLDAAGIYVIIDVNTPQLLILRTQPACLYNLPYLENVFATVNEFAGYNNTLGFFAANEVIDSLNTTFTAPYVKAVIRDIKTFLHDRNLRQIPVGYSAADVLLNRVETAEYMNCGTDDMARGDFFGINDYLWCGNSSFTRSGYSQKMQLYANYLQPIILSEFGCNQFTGSDEGLPRPFTEIEAIFSEEMLSVFSGGLVYQYTNETNNYGLVQLVLETNVTKLPDFYTLKLELAKTENPSGDGGYHTGGGALVCPSVDDDWEAEDKLPLTPSAAAEFFLSSNDPEAGGLEDQTDWNCYDGSYLASHLYIELVTSRAVLTALAGSDPSTTTRSSGLLGLLLLLKGAASGHHPSPAGILLAVAVVLLGWL